MLPIDDHPLRYRLANELHARPFPRVSDTSNVLYIVFKHPGERSSRDRDAERSHLIALLDRHGAPHPQPDATHYAGQIGRNMLKWEQHAEFVTYTVFCEGIMARPFDPLDFEVLPEDWLAAAPGQRITSAILRCVLRLDEVEINASLGEWFEAESLAVARVLDDSAVIAGDFRIDTAGHLRFAIFVNPGTGQRRIGRVIQRLCEIETYKSMSMLGFYRAGGLSGKIAELDSQLTELMSEMTGDDAPAETTLHDLLTISAELEATVAKASFRFGATGAYEAIVNQRIAALRETRIDGRQSFGEFMMRRYEPAMRTVKSTERRLKALADRAIRAGDLLRTRVDVERSAQNRALLESMNHRADQQLQLQHTVEGLSVVAISYYAVSLLGYLAYPLIGITGLTKGMLTALVTLPVVATVWWAVRQIRKKFG